MFVGGSALRPALIRAPIALRTPPPAAVFDILQTAFLNPSALPAFAAAARPSPLPMAALYAACDLFLPINIGLAPVCGALFDFPTALAVVLFGGAVAATAAFFIGRTLQERVLQWLERHARVRRQFAFVDRAITNGGFKAVFLLRLIPTPVPALNFLYGLTGVRGTSYVLATLLGNLPGSAIIVCSTGLTKQLLVSRSSLHLGPLRSWPLLIVAVLCIAGVTRLGLSTIQSAKSMLNELAGEDDCSVELLDSDEVADGPIPTGCRPWLWDADAEINC